MPRRSFALSAIEGVAASFFITVLTGSFFPSPAEASPAEIASGSSPEVRLRRSERSGTGDAGPEPGFGTPCAEAGSGAGLDRRAASGTASGPTSAAPGAGGTGA
jgi:hypothetical protein